MKNHKALCFLYDKKYSYQGDMAIKSAREHNPDYTIVHLTDDKTSSIADVAFEPKDIGLEHNKDWIIVGRLYMVDFILNQLHYNSCIFLDGDTYTYNNYKYFQEQLDDGHSLVVTPHITKPLPEDNLHPQNRVICLAGNYNAGIWGITKKASNFLDWWKYQTALFPKPIPEAGLASEQGWLRFACDFDDNVKICKHPGYNVAYWNVKQREVQKIDEKWIIDSHNLCVFHFSGLKKGLPPEFMSIFQNRYILEPTDPVYYLYKNYYGLIWGEKIA